MSIVYDFFGGMYNTLVSILSHLDDFMDPNGYGRVRIMQSDIDVPVHLKDGAAFRVQQIGIDLNAGPGTISLDKGGMGKVSVDGHFSSGGVTVGVIFTVEYSDDGVNWEVDYVSGAAETDVAYTANSAAQYWRISVPATGAGNDYVDLKLAGVN